MISAGRMHSDDGSAFGFSDDVEVRRLYPVPAEVRERALLVGIERRGAAGVGAWSLESSLAELTRLAYTAGADVVGITSQKLANPDPATFVGSGKVTEIAEMALERKVDVIIFDDELTPTQQSNIERSVSRDIKVIDRTALILDIFALHAKTREGRLQVRLAQNQYLYPRLRGMWAHLASNRMGGGVGSRFGEGESQLEVDRRMIRNRITSIKRELATLSKVRSQQRSSRYSSGVYKVALAGYTNAGKSSLLNSLCEAEVYSDDLLFATLDSTTRKLRLPEGRETTLTDTVGFIQKLPTTLVEAFKSTLDEVSGADLILHVVDISDESYEKQMSAVDEVLGQIGASASRKMLVFNKIDLIDGGSLDAMKRRYPTARFVSSVAKVGIADLIDDIAKAAASSGTLMHLSVPFENGSVTSLVHRRCHIISEEYLESGASIVARVPSELASSLSRFEENPER